MEKLEDLESKDNKFKMIIVNSNHAIIADSSNKRVQMWHGSMQITVAVTAKIFGNTSSEVMRLLESVHWYNAGLKQDLITNGAPLNELQSSLNVFAYLASIEIYLAKLMIQYGIPFKEGQSGGSSLFDPSVKNAWDVLPRTKPSLLLKVLTQNDKRIVCAQLLNTLNKQPFLSNCAPLSIYIYDYILHDGEIASHSINDAQINNEQAILFEFREVPVELKKYLPPEQFIDSSDDDISTLASGSNGGSASPPKPPRPTAPKPKLPPGFGEYGGNGSPPKPPKPPKPPRPTAPKPKLPPEFGQ